MVSCASLTEDGQENQARVQTQQLCWHALILP